MMLGRFSFGPYAIWFPIVLNALACIGWVRCLFPPPRAPCPVRVDQPAHSTCLQSTINTIVGASALQAVTDTHQLPQPVGIIIISLITLVIALFGYKYVHALERYASIPVFIIFMIIFGEGGKYMHGGFGELGSGEPAAILSFGGTIAGFALGWTSLAADYTVNFPVETADWKVFACTYAGLNFPLILIECLGALMMSTFVDKPSWGARYKAGGLGGLLRAGLSPLGGFGQFLLVILALSIVTNVRSHARLLLLSLARHRCVGRVAGSAPAWGEILRPITTSTPRLSRSRGPLHELFLMLRVPLLQNIPNVYSFALTVQSFHKSIQRVPRFSLCILCTAICTSPGALQSLSIRC